MKNKKRNSGRNSGRKPTGPRLVEQPHGGALLEGGLPGNGGGRPSSELRARLRGCLEARLNVVLEILDDPEARPADKLGALHFLARYGLGVASATEIAAEEKTAASKEQRLDLSKLTDDELETLNNLMHKVTPDGPGSY